MSLNKTISVIKFNVSDFDSYCVRPNSGRVEPGKQVEVQGSSASYNYEWEHAELTFVD